MVEGAEGAGGAGQGRVIGIVFFFGGGSVPSSFYFGTKLSLRNKMERKTYSIECASDPRFKVQGAQENFALYLESSIMDPKGIRLNTF